MPAWCDADDHLITWPLNEALNADSSLVLMQTLNASSQNTVFLDDGSGPPQYPSTGQHIISLDIGDVVDVIVINDPANSFNGDLTYVLMQRHVCFATLVQTCVSPPGCLGIASTLSNVKFSHHRCQNGKKTEKNTVGR